MKFVTRRLVALPLLAIALGIVVPMFADAIVEGDLFQAVNGAGSFTYDTGPLAQNNLIWSFTCTTACVGYGISANGSAKVVNGSLGASATVNVTGAPPSNFEGEADSLANYTDTLTITGGSGNGVLALTYTLDGSINAPSGTNLNAVELLIMQASGGYHQLDGGAVTSGLGVGIFGNGTKTDTVAFYIPFTYGTALSIEPWMAANAPFVTPGDATPYSSTVDYFNTATLDSAQVFAGTPLDLQGQNNDAVIASSSGLNYGPAGITSPVPEPGSWVLLASAIAAVAFLKRGKPCV